MESRSLGGCWGSASGVLRPVNPEHLCQYTAFLTHSLCVSSISQYHNVIGILHRQFGLPIKFPLLNNWPLKNPSHRY